MTREDGFVSCPTCGTLCAPGLLACPACGHATREGWIKATNDSIYGTGIEGVGILDASAISYLILSNYLTEWCIPFMDDPYPYRIVIEVDQKALEPDIYMTCVPFPHSERKAERWATTMDSSRARRIGAALLEAADIVDARGAT